MSTPLAAAKTGGSRPPARRLHAQAKVEVIVVLPNKVPERRVSIVEFLQTLPPGPRAFDTWEEYNRSCGRKRTRGIADTSGRGRGVGCRPNSIIYTVEKHAADECPGADLPQ